MALHDWQMALGRLVEARASGRELRPLLESLDGLNLEDAEREWLRNVTGTPGFALTSEVPRWWRGTRVERSARLTLAALGESAGQVLGDYMRTVPGFTLFFVAEALAFLDYVATTTALPHVRAVAHFERAVWTLKRAEPSPDAPASEPSPSDTLVRNPMASLVTFPAPPEEVLGALLTDGPLPEETGELHAVLVAPGLPRMWRPATPEEARAFTTCAPSAAVHTLLALPGVSVPTVKGLLDARALQVPTALNVS
jgi:hypothetical protein